MVKVKKRKEEKQCSTKNQVHSNPILKSNFKYSLKLSVPAKIKKTPNGPMYSWQVSTVWLVDADFLYTTETEKKME